MSTSPTPASENNALALQGVAVEMPNEKLGVNAISKAEGATAEPRLGVGRCEQVLISQVDEMIRGKHSGEAIIQLVSLVNQERCETPFSAKDLQALVEGRFSYSERVQKEKRAKKKAKRITNARPPEYSDDALAREFSLKHGQTLKYVATEQQWFHWTGVYWQRDKIGLITEKVRHFTAEKAEYLINESLKTESGKSPAWATQLSSSATISAIERLARSDPNQATLMEAWDANRWIISTPSGVVELKTGVLRKAQPEDYCSKLTAVGPGGDCPIWLRLLDTVTGGDAEVQTYLQRVVGYALTGETGEDALFFFYGTGGNGKSTFLETIKGILNDYATSVPLGTLMASKNERHLADIASLHGARLAVATETESGRSWDETRIKLLTGGDDVKARYMRQDFFEFRPEFKLLIAGNNKPHFDKVDQAISRRMQLIPFTAKISEPDINFPNKLHAEWPGVLQWAIEGALEWQRQGLNPPKAVLAATEEYLKEEDPVGRWVGECCELDSKAQELSADLFESWKQWCEENGEPVGGKNSLTKRLREQFDITTAKLGHSGNRAVKGIRLRTGIEGCGPTPSGAKVPVRADLL